MKTLMVKDQQNLGVAIYSIYAPQYIAAINLNDTYVVNDKVVNAKILNSECKIRKK